MSASLFWVEGWLPVVHQQEGDRRICADPFVAVEERVILAKVKEVRRCHRGNGGVQEFAAECCPGRGYGRFKSGSVAESRGPPVSLDLLVADLQNFIQRQKHRFQQVCLRNSFR